MESEIQSTYSIFVGFVNDMLGVLPSFLIALGILVFFVVMARWSKGWVRKVAGKFWDDPSLQSLASTLVSSLLIVSGVFVAAAILFPGLEAGDLVAVLGLSSVAIGFAFKDIFSNFMAGVLILSQRPFKIGDQIMTNDFDGTVSEISFRATEIETYDARKVIIPNSEIFMNPVIVHTANAKRRTTFSTGVSYDTDIEEAREVILDATRSCDLVESDPAPKVRCMEHADSAIVFDVLFWTTSDRSATQNATDQVCTAVKYALDEAGIEIPFPQRTLHLAADTLDRRGSIPVAVQEGDGKEKRTNGSRPVQ